MKNLDELLNALRDITDIGTVKYEDIKPKFEDIAHTLLCDCVIVKGDIIYRIREIEFYLFRKDYQDFVTYPRTCNTGDWYFHNSGVDLAFIPNMATYSKCTKKYLPGCSYDSTKGMDACSFFTKSTSTCSNSSSYKKLISIE